MKKLLILTALLTLTGCIQPSSQLAAAFHANSNHYIPSDYEADRAAENLAKEKTAKANEPYQQIASKNEPYQDTVPAVAIPEGPPKPSNSVEAEYYRFIKNLGKLAQFANVAMMCQLRSPQWGSDFSMGSTFLLKSESDRLAKKSANPEEFERYVNLIVVSWFRNVLYQPYTIDCPDLFNSKEMAVLDVLVYKMTGGYH